MSRSFSVAGLSYHASQRVFERSRLTASEVSAMLEKKHFYWASTPKHGKSSFALVYDAVAEQYVVAVVAPYDRNIKTLLTLEQFEHTYHPVSPAAKLLARLAIFAGEKQAAEQEVKAPEPELTKAEVAVGIKDPLAWRFVVTRQDGSEVSLPVLSHEDVCQTLLFVFPVQDTQELKRRAVRVIQTIAFLQWFGGALSAVDVPVDEVGGLRVDMLEDEVVSLSAELTQALVKLLSNDKASSANGDARRAARHARKAYRKSLARQQQPQKPALVPSPSHKSAYAVDLQFS